MFLFFLQVLAIIVVTTITANLIIEFNVFSKLRLFRLSTGKVSLLFILLAGLLSPIVTYTLLVAIRDKVNVSTRDLYPILLLTSPIANISESIRLIAPLSFALFGLNVGLLFTVIILARAFLRMLLHVLLVRLRYMNMLRDVLRKISLTVSLSLTNRRNEPVSVTVKRSLRESVKVLRKIIVKLTIAFLVIVVLMCTGLLNLLADYLDPLLTSLGLTHAVVIVVLTQLALYIPGMYVAGTLFMNGDLTVKELIIALLIGALLHRSITYFRTQLPIRTAFFDFNTALRWVLIDLATDTSTCILMILLVSAIL